LRLAFNAVAGYICARRQLASLLLDVLNDGRAKILALDLCLIGGETERNKHVGDDLLVSRKLLLQQCR